MQHGLCHAGSAGNCHRQLVRTPAQEHSRCELARVKQHGPAAAGTGMPTAPSDMPGIKLVYAIW